MTMINPLSLNADSDEVRRGEDHFVALARSWYMGYYLGRLTDATDDELRSVYGLTVASLRAAARDIANGTSHSAPATHGKSFMTQDEILASRLEQMTAELAQRDERIAELTSKLEKRRKRG